MHEGQNPRPLATESHEPSLAALAALQAGEAAAQKAAFEVGEKLRSRVFRYPHRKSSIVDGAEQGFEVVANHLV